jgi:aminoglycoside phosphotransferase (APT) family kinase protein
VASERSLYLGANIETHAKIYQALADEPDVPVPTVYGYEPDPSLLGAPFFVMERIIGQVPADNPHWRTAGFVYEASPERRRAMWEDAVRVLAALHRVDSSRFPFLLPTHGGSGVADHLDYWRRSLDLASAGSPHDTLERGHGWLLAHLPEPAATAFSWGDSRFANIMFREDRVVAVFDWDTASMAGPEADLAWWRFMDGPAAELEGIGSPDQLVQRWQEHTGQPIRNLEWHDVFTAFRLGVILMRLFANMADDGLMPADVAAQQGRDSEPVRALAKLLEELA